MKPGQNLTTLPHALPIGRGIVYCSIAAVQRDRGAEDDGDDSFAGQPPEQANLFK